MDADVMPKVAETVSEHLQLIVGLALAAVHGVEVVGVVFLADFAVSESSVNLAADQTVVVSLVKDHDWKVYLLHCRYLPVVAD